MKSVKLPNTALSYMRGSIKTGFDFTAFNSHCIYNKLSDSSDFGFNYFPYGYHFRYSKWGTINDLGFRSPYNLEWFKENREDIYLVILPQDSDIDVPSRTTTCF